jgi:hypothetical protein
VEEYPGIWGLYFDRDDDGLKDKVPFGTRVLEVELTRREKKQPKPEQQDNESMTLEKKFEELQTRQEGQGLSNDNMAGDKRSLQDIAPLLERLSLNPCDILDAYMDRKLTDESSQLEKPESRQPSEEEYVPLMRESPMPGVTIELGTRQPKKQVTFSDTVSPPLSPSITSASAQGSTWSSRSGNKSRHGARTSGTSATSVNSYEDFQARRKPTRPPKPQTLSGVGLSPKPKRYKKPYIETEVEERHVAQRLDPENSQVRNR